MAKPNFKFQKRQKELERKTKKEEKLLRKQERVTSDLEEEESVDLQSGSSETSSLSAVVD